MKTRKEIMKLMDEQIEKFDTVKYWENTSKDFLDEEDEFKQLHKVRNFKEYCYYISNLGRVMVVKDSNGEWENKVEIKKDSNFSWNNCWIIPVKNGYLENTLIDNDKNIALNTTTDVYNFMIEAGWLDEYEEDRKAKENAEKIVKHNIDSKEYSNDRIELHHIDNNPSNNNLKNLIWVPKSIHQTLHEK